MGRATKKTWLIDQGLVTRVRKIYGARTETEAVTRALEEVLMREDLKKAVRNTSGKIPRIRRVF